MIRQAHLAAGGLRRHAIAFLCVSQRITVHDLVLV
jgi:hypothetical protein